MRIFSILRRCLSTAFNPQIGRSLQPFATTYRSFGHLLVQVFGALKLIERSHPWMRPTARVRPLEVLALAWARTDWRKPWQPVPVFVASISALLFFAVTSFSGMALLGATKASNAYAASMFTSPNEATDIALRAMSDAFGVKVGTDTPLAPSSNGVVDGVVEGFQQVMGLYSMAMLVIAGFILLYIILAAIAATAHEGRFGGGSFNQIWAPIRLVVAIGLLVPLPMNGFAGYNSGQYIVLKLSEFGSGLATNLWVPFAKALMEKQDVMAMPNIEPAASVVRGVLMNEFCAARYERIRAELTDAADEPPINAKWRKDGTRRYVNYTVTTNATSRYCGETSYDKKEVGTPFVIAVYAGYEKAYAKMRKDVQALAVELSNNPNLVSLSDEFLVTGKEDAVLEALIKGSGDAKGFVDIVSDYQKNLAQVVNDTQETAQDTSAKDALTEDVEKSGWAGASLWFNAIARMNAEFMAAARAMPNSKAPDLQTDAQVSTGHTSEIAELVKKGIDNLTRRLDGLPARLPDFGYDPDVGTTSVGDVSTSSVAAGFGDFHSDSESNWAQFGSDLREGLGRNVGVIIDSVFRTDMGGPFDHMGTGADEKLDRNNPLADLAAIGDWMIARSFALLIPATVINSQLLTFLGITGAGTGLMLFYVLPLLPFIRFLFGVVGWLLNILEAIIAIPLVAVAHLSTKGEGISGDMARTAYSMIFSIFLRPALLIVGMIVSLMMFSVAIGLLNTMYKAAVEGFRGVDTGQANGGLAVIVYTIIYTVMAYMLCNLCFKLIEEIPNKSMSWINAQSAGREITQDERVVSAISGAGDRVIMPIMRLGKGG